MTFGSLPRINCLTLSLLTSRDTEQKEKLSEVEQQLKKAEAAQRRRMQNEKAARESEVHFYVIHHFISVFYSEFKVKMEK